MAELINLRTARKRKERAQKEVKAEENRAIFGQTKAVKRQRTGEKTRADKHLDGHKKE